MARRGRTLTELEVQKIIHLLSSTEMSIGDIAERMGCSHSVIVSINRKFRVRDYAGLRRRWTVTNRAH
jgi:predicted transcriptional regulator